VKGARTASEQYGPEPAQTDFIEAVKRILYTLFSIRMPLDKKKREREMLRARSFVLNVALCATLAERLFILPCCSW